MSKFKLLLSIGMLIIVSCKKREEFHKVKGALLIEMLQEYDNFNTENVIFRNKEGKSIPKFDLSTLDYTKLGFDLYISEDTIIREVRLRNPELKDDLLRLSFSNKNFKPSDQIELRDIQKSEVKRLLDQVYITDQQVRHDGSTEDIRTADRINQKIVVSILEKYGLPRMSEVGYNGVLGCFLTIQHASPELRLYYYPKFLKASENNQIDLFAIALLEDRILTDHGYSQIYGTQYGALEAFPIKDSVNVNQRRKEMGLDPL